MHAWVNSKNGGMGCADFLTCMSDHALVKAIHFYLAGSLQVWWFKPTISLFYRAAPPLGAMVCADHEHAPLEPAWWGCWMWWISWMRTKVYSQSIHYIMVFQSLPDLLQVNERGIPIFRILHGVPFLEMEALKVWNTHHVGGFTPGWYRTHICVERWRRNEVNWSSRQQTYCRTSKRLVTALPAGMPFLARRWSLWWRDETTPAGQNLFGDCDAEGDFIEQGTVLRHLSRNKHLVLTKLKWRLLDYTIL